MSGRRVEAEHVSRWAPLFAPRDAAAIGIFRIGFGLMLAWQAGEFLDGRLDRLYIRPAFHFPYPGFEWVPQASGGVLTGLLWTLLGAGLLIALGVLTRLCSALWALGYTFLLLQDAATYNNHEYLLCLLTGIMAVVPADRVASVSRLFSDTRRPQVVESWALWLLRFQVGVPYLFGGIAKLNADWLLRAQPMRVWFADGSEGLARFDVLTEPWVPWVLSWSGMLLDLFALPLLLWPKSRPWTIAILVAFHVTNSQLFHIGIFPWLMIWATTLFLPADWPRRARLLRPATAPAKRATALPPSGRQAAIALCLAAYVGLQVVLPFRHFLYPGNVDWNEHGHRFAWRMKLRDKRGELHFVAVDPTTGRRLPLDVPVNGLLNLQQRLMLMHDPQMIRRVAAHVAAEIRRGGMGPFEVRVDSQISFNGRPPQPFVRADLDLGSLPPDATVEDWIEPLRPPRDR